MISGSTVKYFSYCPQIVRLTSMGFQERVTEAMMEGKEVDREKVINFLYGTLKPLNIVRGPIFRYKNLVGSPDYVLFFPNFVSPLDLKQGRERRDHVLQILFYLYVMELKGFNVKEGLLYYVREGKLKRIKYSFRERRIVRKTIEEIREAMRGKVRVTQPVQKCYNCGFFRWCRPRIEGGISTV
ncbi:CRISPR-associated protein Cas4 [Metallosphaera hakonensis]|uniref:CRISPR-associated exonuclease Cas4 n=1 Tax=Metallosphaera hakonensis JCM 8857 = DSM 7519 TaxID=1293036 RepID=A0A2U9IWK2_9CREN|nr:CRISPR-associated protein Cas4 [Metallosphaera hakonensis]AWS00430.1 CRISPR-associated protein Cas4 [Metallosphaera hakonensis JCM 8857 = DSM 7519]